MKKILFFILCLFTLAGSAQYRWDFGMKFGAANYLGDIGGKELTRRDFVVDMHLRQTRFAVDFFARYKKSKRLAFGFNGGYYRIQDADRFSTNPARRARNMNFRDDIIELGGRAELTLWYDNDVGNRGYYNPDFKLYLFLGISGFYYKPMGQIFKYEENTQGNANEFTTDGVWYNLRNFMTEGQSKQYSMFGVAIPAGIGMHFTFNKSWRVGWELSWRTTFTDYLDDISTYYAAPNSTEERKFVFQTSNLLLADINSSNPDISPLIIENFEFLPNQPTKTKRGDPTHNDSYLTSQFMVSKVIRGRSQFYRSKYSWVKNRAGVRRSRAKF
jgi:Domain of unknown function (DUF6089)